MHSFTTVACFVKVERSFRQGRSVVGGGEPITGRPTLATAIYARRPIKLRPCVRHYVRRDAGLVRGSGGGAVRRSNAVEF